MINKQIAIVMTIIGDGTSTSFVIDLRKDPFHFVIDANSVLSPAFDILRDPPLALQPSSDPVLALTGYKITVTFSAPPSSQQIAIGLLY